ncbi:hypothetical protein OR16_33883 [Cupriavidus basilensis OR16]|uniref:Uncharacterized protein n=1 Tax=Cupriavidus basilensis OR16 TaxID=1127483 RepID=H1SEP1_9BURK|nr:hypothetical protein OR16_33883 [Cupriavidus basilensis OR16]
MAPQAGGAGAKAVFVDEQHAFALQGERVGQAQRHRGGAGAGIACDHGNAARSAGRQHAPQAFRLVGGE